MNRNNTLINELKAAVENLDIAQVRSLTQELTELVEKRLTSPPLAFYESLLESVDTYDHVRTRSLCDDFRTTLRSRETPYPVIDAHKILDLLRRKRLFSELSDTADVFIQTGTNAPVIIRFYTQALIEENHLSASHHILKQLEARCEVQDEEHELSEARGLLGRVHKQVYINGAHSGKPGPALKAALKSSYQYYADEYQDDKSKLWHGVNMLAVWLRAKKDDVRLPPMDFDVTTKHMLNTIQVEITNQTLERNIGMWTQASAAEICISLGNYDEALKWIGLYVDERHIKEQNSDAFEIGSTLRQLEELWQFDTKHPQQAHILQVLRSSLLKRHGGSVEIHDLTAESSAITEMLKKDEEFEKVLGSERFNNLRWLQTGLDRARCVCKIEDQFGDGIGTGFLMRPAQLSLDCPQKWVVLTNAHVVSTNSGEQGGTPAALAPDKVVIRFEASDNPSQVYKVNQILASSPRVELDFSVLTLAEDIEFPYTPADVANQLPVKDQKQRIYVIGHPRGGNLSFSLYDNMLLDHEIPKIHYRSPTQGGSSGSPVFNQSWGLIGLHHAGGSRIDKLNGQSGQYATNEGLWIGSITDFIKRQLI